MAPECNEIALYRVCGSGRVQVGLQVEVWPVAETALAMTALHIGGTKLTVIFHVYMLPYFHTSTVEA